MRGRRSNGGRRIGESRREEKGQRGKERREETEEEQQRKQRKAGPGKSMRERMCA